ncbi:hypothetical protein [Helicobacter macacae]|uniref:hypothetical protein n=1 Tax=Helicobacter macacae TaxID=398626 RepID=UPI0012EC9FA4|nr:hypothetical protein [Helicobacter macacae]
MRNGKTTKEVKNRGNRKQIATPLFVIARLDKVKSKQSATPRHCENLLKKLHLVCFA